MPITQAPLRMGWHSVLWLQAICLLQMGVNCKNTELRHGVCAMWADAKPHSFTSRDQKTFLKVDADLDIKKEKKLIKKN